MLLPNRKGSAGSYRYGFQGQEKDDELKGEGNSINFKFRMHDPRVGRFFAEDPLAKSFEFNSPYAFAENRVVDGVELEGAEYIFYTVTFYNEATGQCHINKTGEIDYSNWILNGATKIFGNFELYGSHLVQSPVDGRFYFFANEEEAYTATISDFDPKTRYTLDGLQSLFQITDAVGGVFMGIGARMSQPKGVSSTPKTKVKNSSKAKHKNATPTPKPSIENSFDKLDQLRKRLGLKAGKRNVAIAKGDINGKSIHTEAVSGANDMGLTKTTETSKTFFKKKATRHKSGSFDKSPRDTDSEAKILEDIAHRLVGKPGVYKEFKGTITIFSDRTACSSCRGVAKQFRKMFPNIKVRIIGRVKQK